MGELSFLIELLLNHKLAKPTRDLIAARIRDLEQGIPQQMKINTNGAYTVRNDSILEGPPMQQNSAVQAALAQRQAIMNGRGDRSLFKAKPKPAPQ